ncbi:penicillin-binding protein 2 [Pikeienuella piscinae]|uniref:Penicillin-binding protein 2 n=1 Tax=Pikeienuella piscinae TaxID=2748098 RepID=A0A7M3T6L6_9RHOB|nr:penicillin-binding protein 2 [Pikeienuella piscinae]QIE57647.1 penicillin-binding protein 2 [Pikeienuella piscinae]
MSAGADLVRVLGDGAETALARRAERRERAREEKRRARADRAEWRLLVVSLFFLVGFGVLGGRMALLAVAEPKEPRLETAASRVVATERAAITDRNGRLLAANLPTWAIYAHPHETALAGVDADEAARRLGAVLPEIGEETFRARFAPGRKFVWIKRPATPDERQAVHDLGIPGIYFGRRETRIYPAGRIGAHILGGVTVGAEGVDHAELVGLAGVERRLDKELRDPARAGRPMPLSIDLVAQTALTDVMGAAMTEFSAIAASAVLMDARNGEVLAMVSLPDFDPNNRPDTRDPRVAKVRPMMNRAAEGVYEFGSTFKLFTAAQAIDSGLYTPESMIDTKGPLRVGKFKINDFHRMPPRMTLRDVIVESSNVGTSNIALAIGAEAQKAFLRKIGMLDPTSIEIAEARLGQPLYPARWSQLSTMTISFGHGLAATQLHLAAAYASLLNGGLRVHPTLRRGAPAPTEADRVISASTSRSLREILRAVVAEEKGTANFAEVPGFEVGGKTGTADKPARGGYDESKTLSTFAAAFPMSSPKYVLVVTLDEASTFRYGRTWRTAGWTAAPTAALAVERLAPILHMRPIPAPETVVAGDVGKVRF